MRCIESQAFLARLFPVPLFARIRRQSRQQPAQLSVSKTLLLFAFSVLSWEKCPAPKGEWDSAEESPFQRRQNCLLENYGQDSKLIKTLKQQQVLRLRQTFFCVSSTSAAAGERSTAAQTTEKQRPPTTRNKSKNFIKSNELNIIWKR